MTYTTTTIACFRLRYKKKDFNFSKRSMMTFTKWVSKFMNNKPLYPHARGLIWQSTMRYNEPVKNTTPPPMEIDPVTGFEIMHPTDYSGHNHILLRQWDYKSETFYAIRGSFTTSFSPFKGKYPVFISDFTLEGKPKTQYLHVYDRPKLIRISDTIGMDFTTMFLPTNDVLDAIIKQHSSTGLNI